MSTVKELVLRLAAETPSLSNGEIAAEIRRRMPDRRTTAGAVAAIKSRNKRARSQGMPAAKLPVLIRGNRLRTLRQGRGLSRADLANRANVSAAQIQRLETTKRVSTSRAVRARLAKALAVNPDMLTGGARLPALGQPPVPARATVTLPPEARLAYDLVARRYRYTDENGQERGVGVKELSAIAPLLFVLVAEGSLAWRKEELESLREALGRAQAFVWRSDRHRFAHDVSSALNWSGHEADAIERRDLFGDPLPADHRHHPQAEVVNPFADYLLHLAKDASADVARVSDGWAWPFPAYRVCEGDLKEIAGGSVLAALALASGDVRLSDLPEHLLGDGETAESAIERTRWIEERASENTRKLAELGFPLGGA